MRKSFIYIKVINFKLKLLLLLLFNFRFLLLYYIFSFCFILVLFYVVISYWLRYCLYCLCCRLYILLQPTVLLYIVGCLLISDQRTAFYILLVYYFIITITTVFHYYSDVQLAKNSKYLETDSH